MFHLYTFMSYEFFLQKQQSFKSYKFKPPHCSNKGTEKQYLIISNTVACNLIWSNLLILKLKLLIPLITVKIVSLLW
jgi:hypothetical protein